METFYITYTAYDNNNNVVKDGTMKVKNNWGEVDAQGKLEAYLKRKYPLTSRMIVHRISKTNISDMFGGIFGGIFK
jgi:DNA-binding transcriptional regulator LsrR (DeoR family)